MLEMDYDFYNDFDDVNNIIYVMLECTLDKFPELELEDVLDVEEDSLGRDLLTFTCPKCGQEHKSYRIG